MNNTILLRFFRETKTRYLNCKSRLYKSIPRVDFKPLSSLKQPLLIQRFSKIVEELKYIQTMIKLGTVGAALSLIITSGTVVAQEQNTNQLLFKTNQQNKNSKYNPRFQTVKMEGVDSVFIQRRQLNSPFGGTNPFDAIYGGEGNSPLTVDLDNDGDLDYILCIRDNVMGGYSELRYFENMGNNMVVELNQYDWDNNPFTPLEGRGRPTFVDIDNDGDKDAFTHDLFIRNIGTPTASSFEEISGAENPLEGISNGYNDGQFTDIDNDGDQDYVVSEYETISIFENTGNAENPVFSTESITFEGMPAIHMYAILLIDIDNDDDFDIITMDDGFVLIENTGTATTPNFEYIEDEQFVVEGLVDLNTGDYLNGIDYDNDGDIDLYLESEKGLVYLFENIGTASEASFKGQNGMQIKTGQPSPEMVDIDNDGDFDCLYIAAVNDDNILTLIRNTGDNVNPQFENEGSILDANLGWSSQTLGDIDNDGDLDLLVANSEGTTLFINIGTASAPVFEEASNNPFSTLSNVNNPKLVDIDADGDLDLFYSGESSTVNYRNTGTPENAVFTEEPSLIEMSMYHSMGRFAFTDLDNDGDLDCFVAAFNEMRNKYEFQYYENVGTAENPDFVLISDDLNPLAGVEIPNADLTFADMDNDDDDDLIVGYGNGSFFFYFENLTINIPVNIEEQVSVVKSMKLFPNPASDFVTVEFNTSIDGVIQILDINGRIVEEFQLSGSQNYRLPVNRLKTGAYILKINSQEGIQVSQFIKK